MATTLLSNLVNPQVMGDLIDKKLVNNMVFAPLCTIDTTLEGRPGSTITLPYYSYIGDASTVAENSAIGFTQLVASTVSATIHKIAKGVQITDEAVLSGYGDPMGEAGSQVVKAIASQLDNEALGVLNAITGAMVYQTAASTTPLAPADINLALEKFGEDMDGVKVAVVSPALYTQLRTATGWIPASEIAADMVVKGAVGEAFGCQIIVSNKLTTPGTAYIVKPGAIKIYLKRDTLVEADRNIEYQRTDIVATKHEVVYLYDGSKAIKLMKKA